MNTSPVIPPQAGITHAAAPLSLADNGGKASEGLDGLNCRSKLPQEMLFKGMQEDLDTFRKYLQSPIDEDARVGAMQELATAMFHSDNEDLKTAGNLPKLQNEALHLYGETFKLLTTPKYQVEAVQQLLAYHSKLCFDKDHTVDAQRNLAKLTGELCKQIAYPQRFEVLPCLMETTRASHPTHEESKTAPRHRQELKTHLMRAGTTLALGAATHGASVLIEPAYQLWRNAKRGQNKTTNMFQEVVRQELTEGRKRQNELKDEGLREQIKAAFNDMAGVLGERNEEADEWRSDWKRSALRWQSQELGHDLRKKTKQLLGKGKSGPDNGQDTLLSQVDSGEVSTTSQSEPRYDKSVFFTHHVAPLDPNKWTWTSPADSGRRNSASLAASR